jgi:hypothetical protein
MRENNPEDFTALKSGEDTFCILRRPSVRAGKRI